MLPSLSSRTMQNCANQDKDIYSLRHINQRNINYCCLIVVVAAVCVCVCDCVNATKAYAPHMAGEQMVIITENTALASLKRGGV